MSGAGEPSWKDITQDLAADLEQAASLLRNTSAIHDPLTGLVSAAYLELRLQEETARSERVQIPFSLVAISILGPANATAGLSDSLIKDTAAILKANLRVMDVVARVSRLEFLCLIPEAGAAEAAAVTKRLTDVVNGEQLAGVRLVAGAATFPSDGADAASLIAAARLALLRTRTAGVARRTPGEHSLVPATTAVVSYKDQAASLRSVAEAAHGQPGRVVSPMSQTTHNHTLAHSTPERELDEMPVAVGYVTGARFPVSYWRGNELVSIEAVLEEHQGDNETSLLVQTTNGLAQLTCRGRRWYAVHLLDEAIQPRQAPRRGA